MKLTDSWNDYHYYFFSGGGQQTLIFLFAVIVMPIVYLIILKPLFSDVRTRLNIAFASIVIVVVAVYWDVAIIARQSQKLCTSVAGMRIFKTVHVEGFFVESHGGSAEEDLPRGFSYIEYRDYDLRRARLVDGVIKSEKVDNVKSTYEVVVERKDHYCCGETRSVVRHRPTGEVIGELVKFKIYPAWASFSLFPGYAALRSCVGPKEPPSFSPSRTNSTRDLVERTLYPIASTHEGVVHE
jgi:hypothetical protein